MNFKIVIIILLNLIITIKSQQLDSLSCIYNGFDYSNLYNVNGYSGVSAYNWANDNEGKYNFYWNICGLSSICKPSDGGVACQKIDSKYQTIGEAYNYKWSSDSKLNKTSITYYSEQKNCPNNRKRQFTINLICTDDELYSTNVFEDEPCYYSVTMYGACGKKVINSDSSDSIETNNCIYDGIDYSSISTSIDYKSLKGDNFRKDSANYKYEYYWNLCKSSKTCGPNVAACQKEFNMDDGKETGRTQIIGQLSKGVWSKDDSNNATIITYSTDNNVYCQNGEKSRKFKIYLICDNNNNNNQITTYEINEDEECVYYTKIYACGIQTK